MNFKLSAVVMLLIGIVLIYGAMNNKDPRDVVREALRKPAKYGPIGEAVGDAAGGGIQAGAGALPANTTPKPPVVSV